MTFTSKIAAVENFRKLSQIISFSSQNSTNHITAFFSTDNGERDTHRLETAFISFSHILRPVARGLRKNC